MAKNAPRGDGRRIGAVKGRTQVENPSGHWTKRGPNGRFNGREERRRAVQGRDEGEVVTSKGEAVSLRGGAASLRAQIIRQAPREGHLCSSTGAGRPMQATHLDHRLNDAISKPASRDWPPGDIHLSRHYRSFVPADLPRTATSLSGSAWLAAQSRPPWGWVGLTGPNRACGKQQHPRV